MSGVTRASTAPGRESQLLRLADVFFARAAARADRRAMAPSAIMRALFAEEADGPCTPLVTALVSTLGLYPPGSFVNLANGEIAVVTRNTSRLNAPMVMAIVGKDGIALAKPRVRDTADPAYAVQDAVPSDLVKVRLDPSRVIDPR